MGLAASQARLMMLTARKSDLEFELQSINQARMTLAQLQASKTVQQMDMFKQGMAFLDQRANMGDTTALQQQNDMMSQMQHLQQMELAPIQHMDRTLEMKAKQVEIQHQAIQTEMEAVNKVIQKNIETSFKLMG